MDPTDIILAQAITNILTIDQLQEIMFNALDDIILSGDTFQTLYIVYVNRLIEEYAVAYHLRSRTVYKWRDSPPRGRITKRRLGNARRIKRE